MNKKITKKDKCSGCNGSNLVQVLDLSPMPLANAFINQRNPETEDKFPLTVSFCNDCSLLQIMELVDPNILFREYDYMTSASVPLISHFGDMAGALVKEFVQSRDDFFVDIGGNDGTLLSTIKDKCRVLNIDPAQNLGMISRQKGVDTLTDFFGSRVAKSVVENHGNARVVTANNVFAHIADIRDAFAGAGVLIGDAGVLVVEVHWVGNLIGDGGFDQVYHEHLCYWSLTALKALVNSLGMEVFRVEMIPFQGESMRVFISKKRKIENSVFNLIAREKSMGLDKKEAFLTFRDKVEKNKAQLTSLLRELKEQGKTIIGYGATAKGNTLLNYFGIDSAILSYITDTTPFKQGKHTPGMHIEVKSPDILKTDRPDYVLLLAWNYADAILEKEKALRNQGTKFIIPVPEVKIV